jgi:hypothetical protein
MLRTLKFAAILGIILGSIAIAHAACGLTETCPLDGQTMTHVRDEYSGIVKIAVYAHTTTTGETHAFRFRCN